MGRSCHFPAVVQPAGNVELVALFLCHCEVLVGAVVSLLHRVSQHHGKNRHPVAVTAGVGRLLIDGRGDELNE